MVKQEASQEIQKDAKPLMSTVKPCDQPTLGVKVLPI